MASTDQGTNWALSDDFVYPTTGSETATRYDGGMACDLAGNLYVAGRVYQPYHWLVRRSGDGGLNWTTVDDVAGRGDTQPKGVATDAQGNVYVVGVLDAPNGTGSWTVRKGLNGINFTTVDNFASGDVEAIYAHPTKGVFAVGSAYVCVKNKISEAWTVRRSVDEGATWYTVNSFQLSSGYSASAYGIGADTKGNLYVVGGASVPYRGSSPSHWLVRKSADGGASWSTVDDYQLSTNSSTSTAKRFTADSYGNLFVTGLAVGGPSLGTTWIVRESQGGTGAWTTVDNYQYVAGGQTEPEAIAADASGIVFVGGRAWPGGSSGNHWLVRRN
jgi:hypothetical protein